MKKIRKQMAEGSFYPGESHSAILLSHDIDEDGHMELATILFIGEYLLTFALISDCKTTLKFMP